MFYRALVVATDDPSGLHRVRLQIPQLFGDSETNWATPMDFYLNDAYLPQVGDQVWASFEGEGYTYPLYLPSISRARNAAQVLTLVPAKAALKSTATLRATATV